MDGLARPSGAKMTFEMDGKTYILGPFTLSDFGTLENHVLRLKRKARLQMILDIRESMPDDLWQEEWEKAKADAARVTKVPEQEVVNFLDNKSGIAFTLFMMFEKNYPGEFTLRELEEKMMAMSDEAIEQLKMDRDQAINVDEASKNSTGPTFPVVGKVGRREKRRRRARPGGNSSG